MIHVLWIILVLFIISPVSASAQSSIEISEFLPNPPGNDEEGEWIELQNMADTPVSLEGWQISDVYGSTKTYGFGGEDGTFPVMDPGAFLLLSRSVTGITLNNDAEQIVLADPEGRAVVSGLFSPVQEDVSYALIDCVWSTASPTPGKENSPLPSPTPGPSVLPTPSQSPSPSPRAGVVVEVSACEDAMVNEHIAGETRVSSPTPSPQVLAEMTEIVPPRLEYAHAVLEESGASQGGQAYETEDAPRGDFPSLHIFGVIFVVLACLLAGLGWYNHVYASSGRSGIHRAVRSGSGVDGSHLRPFVTKHTSRSGNGRP